MSLRKSEGTKIDDTAPVRASAELEIEASLDVVWSTLADIGSWPDWNPSVERAALKGPVVPGTRFSWRAGGMNIESRLEQVSRPDVLAWSGATLGVRAVHVSRFEGRGEGTLATTEESFSGPLPWLFRGRLRKMLRGSLESGLLALKKESERRDARPRDGE